MMTAENFIKYIKDNSKLSTKEFNELKKITEKYPYFQTAHALYIQAAKNVGNDEYLKTLETSSAFVSNRERLYYLISGLETKKIENKKTASSTKEALEILNKKQVTKIKSKTTLNSIQPKPKNTEKPVKVIVETNKKKENNKNLPENTLKKVQVTVETSKDIIPETKENKPKTTSKERHDSLINDFFADRTKQQIENKKEETPSVSDGEALKKTNETKKPIRDKKQITDDIFAKIEALKNEKPIPENKENTISQKIVTKNKVHISTPLKEKKTVETNLTKEKEKEKENIQKVVIVTEKKDTVKPIETVVKTISAEDIINKISENITTTPPETTKRIKPSGITEVPNKKISKVDKIEILQNENKKEETKETETIPTAQELINKFILQAKKEAKSTDKITEEKIQNTNDTKLPTEKKEIEIPQQKEKKIVAADNLMARIAALKNKKVLTTEEKTEKNNNLINKFVEDTPRLDTSKEPEMSGDVSEESTKSKEEVVTELMASIYINQGHTDKAITVYEKLILKYPEKKSYFVNLISELKKEVI